MARTVVPLPELFDRLESFHGAQEPCWPTDPYRFLVWWHCGYPPSDAACTKGWDSLSREVGVEPRQLLDAGTAGLAAALKPGGMVPELRAMRLMEIAVRVEREFGGDLRAGLSGPIAAMCQTLRKFPNIAAPGAERILLFGDIAPVAAVPSNCPHVLVRIRRGPERENYGANYRLVQEGIEAEIPAEFHARKRAYLLLKRHGQEVCKRTNPKCDRCPISSACAFFARNQRG